MKKEFSEEIKRYTICILVEDIAGVISQVSRFFSRKGYNIESLVTGETDVPKVTRVSIEIMGDERMVEKIAAQCRKLLVVRSVKIFNEDNCVRREIALIKVNATDHVARSEIIQLASVFRAQILDASLDTLIIWSFGTTTKNAALINLLKDYGILEIAKTGTIAIERGRKTVKDSNKLQEEFDYGKNVL